MQFEKERDQSASLSFLLQKKYITTSHINKQIGPFSFGFWCKEVGTNPYSKKLLYYLFLKGSLKLYKYQRKEEIQIELSVAIDS